ncbi:hypothetical protein FE257_012463 [Aspergillus nanangensis]|uniref:Extracellular membrane protein CFEM domain-containing protein n=1 Tax=Aspergillus nanangensis TaxID=2582783 RepID=A0AAD4GXK1_ASPNN|nr:hypothetical protein FE257_012463 [Aspergillus nanangensis]
MRLSASRWLFFTVLASLSCLGDSADASPRTGTTVSTALPVPSCASKCVDEFIRTEYPKNACPNGRELHCLCTTRTKSGFTLGEAALRCAFSSCSLPVAINSSSYAICDAVHGALPKTHGTIVATVVSNVETKTATEVQPTSSSTKTNLGPTTSSRSGHSHTKHTSTTTATTTFQSPLSATSTIQDASSTSSDVSETQSATSVASHESRLNAGAVIGVSVASGVAGFFILGVLIFFCCRRMRRGRQPPKDRSSFFEIGGLMSEPSNFSLAPKYPGPGAGPSSPDAAEMYTGARTTPRLMSPFQPTPRNPAVTVTTPDHGFYDESRGVYGLGRAGIAYSSTSDLVGSPNQSSPRTVSDLLPEKPVYNALYPEPLRWSQYKSSRPPSGETLFEEDATRPRSILGASNQHPNFSAPLGRYHDNRQPSQTSKVGLPVNPRAMMYGFRGANYRNVVPQSPGYQKKPVFANASEKLQPPQQANMYRNFQQSQPRNYTEQQHDYVGDYWRDPNAGHLRSPVLPARHSFYGPDETFAATGSADEHFETIDMNENLETRRTSRHSGSFRPLTPVREVRTPVNGINQRRDYLHDNAVVQYPRMPVSRAVSPNQEIVSRPRIVRQDDIKKVHIRRGKPQPPTSATPWSPDDYWLGGSRGAAPIRSQPQGSQRLSKEFRLSSEMMGRMPQKRPSPLERKVTPSRRGEDLILSVD